jgi:hypothetical protein
MCHLIGRIRRGHLLKLRDALWSAHVCRL